MGYQSPETTDILNLDDFNMTPDHIQQRLTDQQRQVDDLKHAINILMVQNDKVKSMINEALSIRVSPKLSDDHH